jgi:hypothetical protein
MKIEKGGNHVAAWCTTKAATAQNRDRPVCPLDQSLVERHLAELVDEYSSPSERRLPQHMGQKRGLAASQEAGDQGDR